MILEWIIQVLLGLAALGIIFLIGAIVHLITTFFEEKYGVDSIYFVTIVFIIYIAWILGFGVKEVLGW